MTCKLDLFIVLLKIHSERHWIPAFAGMTVNDDFLGLRVILQIPLRSGLNLFYHGIQAVAAGGGQVR